MEITRILHIWDTRVDSGINLDDLLERAPVIQKSLSRVLVRQGKQKALPQSFQHQLDQIVSPYPKSRFARLISKMQFRRFVKQEIKDFKPDLIFFHFGQTAATYIRLAVKSNTPFVVALYGHDISVAIRKLRWRIKYRIFAKTNGRFLVLADDVRRRVLDLGVRESKISIYNWPLDLGPYLSVQRTLRTKKLRITIPGRLVEKKGHIYLFQALQLLKNRHISVELTVIGYGDVTNYVKVAEDLQIMDQIRWVDTTQATIKGEFDKVYSRVLAESDLIALPCVTSSEGDNEAGPALVLCLAQAAGVPVLTTAFRGHEISIEEDVTGLIAREGNVEDLVEKIIWVIENPDAVEKITVNAKENVRRIFDLDSSVNTLYEIVSRDIVRRP
jgi:glycosyltransferase involved in cell wall biosynthesis